jgi:hypothetical protein
MEREYSFSNLLAFESVVDIDLGIINYMISKYKKSIYFNQFVVNASSENVKRNLLLARKLANPITILLKEEYISSADDMLKDLEAKHMEEILTYCKPNDILKFAKTLESSDGIIRNFISCKNQMQKQYINDLDSSIVAIINETDMTTYNCLFLKYVEQVVQYKNMGGKYIFLLNYMHNIDEVSGLPKKVILAVSGSNKVRTVDPYVGLTLPKIGGEQK